MTANYQGEKVFYYQLELENTGDYNLEDLEFKIIFNSAEVGGHQGRILENSVKGMDEFVALGNTFKVNELDKKETVIITFRAMIDSNIDNNYFFAKAKLIDYEIDTISNLSKSLKNEDNFAYVQE